MSKVAIIENEKITEANYLMSGNTYLTKFSSPMPNLMKGNYMFNGCNVLTVFDIELPKLKEGSYMFSGCPLSSFSQNLSTVVSGDSMFENNDSLVTFTSNLGSLKGANKMFYGCDKLSSQSLNNIATTIPDITGLNKSTDSDWQYSCNDMIQTIPTTSRGVIDIGKNPNQTTALQDAALELYEKGWNVYTNGTSANPTVENAYEVTKINGYIPDASSWNDNVFWPNRVNMRQITKVQNGYAWNGTTKLFKIRHQKLVNGQGLFFQNEFKLNPGEYDLPNFTTWSADMPLLENGAYMFGLCRNLKTFSGDLSSLIDGYSMFNSCDLSTFSTLNLDSLIDGDFMFNGCSLSVFSTPMKSLVSAQSMFSSNDLLTTFGSDLTSLKNGAFMFSSCTALSTFTSPSLKNLLSGYYMFYGCNLNSSSLTHIANVINDISGIDKNIENNWKYISHGQEYTMSTDARGTMHVTVASSVTAAQKNTFTSSMAAKGWNVIFLNY